MKKSKINFMDYLGDKELESLANLVKTSLHRTFKNYTDDIDDWGMKNSMSIMTNVLELCSPDMEQSDDQKRVEKLKDKIKEKDAESPPPQ